MAHRIQNIFKIEGGGRGELYEKPQDNRQKIRKPTGMVLMNTHDDCRDQACELAVAGWSFYTLLLPQGLFALWYECQNLLRNSMNCQFVSASVSS